MLPKACNKYSIDAVIKYEHMIQGYHFYLASVSENSGLTILKVTQFSKAPALDSLSGFFLKNGVKCVTKPITDLCNLSINSKEFPDLRKVAKRKLLYKNGSLIEPSNYKLISLLPKYPNLSKKSFMIWIQKIYYTLTNLVFEKKYSTDLCHYYMSDKVLKGFDKVLMTGMILNDL